MADGTDPPATMKDAIYLHTRREPFEHGLVPIPKLIFSDGITTLGSIKDKLIQRSSQASIRVGSDDIAETLQISPDQARLILDAISAILPFDSDPLVSAKPDEIDSARVNVFDLILFLYIQSYKRLLPRTHKDPASIGDVWPMPSAFDGFLSALSPLQLARSNSRKLMPSQADEEAHQLSYLQKHLANILTLLAEPVDGEGESALVFPMDRFEHLGFLIQFGERGSEGIPLHQAAPFFANSDPDMPAAPVPAAEVHDWLLQSIADSLEYITDRSATKDSGPPSSSNSDQDVAMSDASPTSSKATPSARGLNFIEGVSKSSVVKQAADLNGSSIKVANCHDSVIYVLAPLKFATLYGCSDATIVLGAVGKAVRVEHCERVHVICVSKRICIANCRECVFFLGVNHRPLIVGDNHKLQVAPYNTFYPQLEEHMAEAGVVASVNRWDEALALGLVDPHDSFSHPAGISDVQAETASHIDPDTFTNFLIPKWFFGESAGNTKDNPFPLPEAYMGSQHTNLGEVKQILKETPLEDNKKRELSTALHIHFKDWLYASGNIRQLYCLQAD
ncbi:hypothetical protein V2J09_015946 [Rumex salicifolius]